MINGPCWLLALTAIQRVEHDRRGSRGVRASGYLCTIHPVRCPSRHVAFSAAVASRSPSPVHAYVADTSAIGASAGPGIPAKHTSHPESWNRLRPGCGSRPFSNISFTSCPVLGIESEGHFCSYPSTWRRGWPS
jgi:hypothetical protein